MTNELLRTATPPGGNSPELLGSTMGTDGLLSPQPQNVAAPNYQNQAPEETVESRLTNLLKKDNPYLVGARASAERYAGSRGLQNTSIAAGAGETAAIQSALPIAQQDAGFYQQRNLAGQQGEIQSYLSGQQANQQAGLYNVQGDISSRLQSEQGDIASRQAEQSFQYDKSLKEMGYSHDQLMKQMDVDWNKIDLNARMQVEYDRLSEDNKARFDETSNKISENYQKDMLEIMLNPNFKTTADRQAALDQLNYLTQQRMQIAAKIAGVTLDWGAPKSPYQASTSPAVKTVTGAMPEDTRTDFQKHMDAMKNDPASKAW